MQVSKLTAIKIVHTAIWIFFNVVLGCLLYAVVANSIGILVWIGIGLIVLEGLVLLIFKNKCPLTFIARRYSDSEQDNFDIYLPNWLARYNKQIYGSLFAIIIAMLLFRIFTSS